MTVTVHRQEHQSGLKKTVYLDSLLGGNIVYELKHWFRRKYNIFGRNLDNQTKSDFSAAVEAGGGAQEYLLLHLFTVPASRG